MIDPLSFFKALGVAIVIIALLGWLGFIIYRGFGILFKKLNYRFKKWSEIDVQWCMDAVEQGYDLQSVEKHLLLQDYPKKRVEEMIYLFSKCEKKMKGGKIKDE